MKRLWMTLAAAAFGTAAQAADIYAQTDLSWKSAPPTLDPRALKMNAGAKIPFLRPLPALRVGKTKCSSNNNPEWAMPGVFTGTDAALGQFMETLRDTLTENRRLIRIGGRTLVCNHNWVRDHTHQMKGWCHWERDNTSFLDFILDHPRADGMLYEMIKQLDDGHWRMVEDTSRVLFPEDHMALIRLDLEADVEYLAVEAAHRYWRMSGDDAWVARRLPVLERAIDWQTSDPQHWNAKYGLCIRPFTIDTWDFVPTAWTGGDRRIHPGEPLPAMHGDNTGVCQAMRQLAAMNRHLGRAAKAADWERRAEALKANVMKHLWNGRSFVHQKFFDGEKGLDDLEAVRLSLSDAYALNRGVWTPEENRRCIEEYRRRRETVKTFAEWYTIDPPIANACHKPGEYVNGAVSPFTAGELAKGAFENGYEAYGWDILTRVAALVKRDGGKLYFLYHPQTRAAQGRGPSAWGAAAILSAIDQGLAGIQDTDTLYRTMRFAPRWAVTEHAEGRYLTGYEVSKKKVDVRWTFKDAGFRYRLECPSMRVDAHLLVPSGKRPTRLLVNGRATPFRLVDIFGSLYVDATVAPENGVADFEAFY